MPFVLCADFGLFPDNHPFPPAPSDFVLAGFRFVQNGGPNPLFVNQSGPGRGLQFEPTGVRINLPVPRSRARLVIGTFAGPVDVHARDSAGNVLQALQVPGTNTFQTVQLRTRRRFAAVMLTGGGFEGSLAEICITV